MNLPDSQLLMFLRAMPVACLLVDADGNIRLMNGAAEALFGWSEAEIGGKSVLILVPERSRVRVPVPGSLIWEEARPQLPARGIAVLALRRDGTECPVEVDLTPLIAEQGPRGVVAMIRDLSGQLHDRERMLLHLSDLAHASRLSTMGEMVAGLAHELNQPLYAVSNYARACRELVRRYPDVEQQLAPIAEKLSEQTERAAEIVRRLRRFMSRRMPQRMALDINSLVRDVEQLMLFHAHRFSISTELRLAPQLPKVAGDPILIEQILVNLLRNAFEAMGEARTPSGNVVVQTSHDGDRIVTVTVTDNGPGFGEIPLEQLFEPFYTTKEQGMGLGLVISRSIAEAHGGRLTAERHPAGAAFHLTLMIEEAAAHV